MADRMMALLVITREFTFVNRRKNRKNMANEGNNEKLMALINGDDDIISLFIAHSDRELEVNSCSIENKSQGIFRMGSY